MSDFVFLDITCAGKFLRKDKINEYLNDLWQTQSEYKK